uniref:Uncharacterized protein n=1 Tax=Tanacetum cinerariifolium TaxID=118510 RepID=A0A6L2JS37_TANCI|nr:hypothetical protein [Tanacetum cinerariifolium]
MDTTKVQQIALDDALVAPANRLKIRKCNHRLSSDLKSNEPTIQVATVSTHHHSLRLKMNDRSHTLNVENFKDMLHIYPRLPGQSFEDPPLEEEILSFIRDLGHIGETKDTHVYGAILPAGLTNQEMLDSKAYKEYYAVASGAKPPKEKQSTRRRLMNLSLLPSPRLLLLLKESDSSPKLIWLPKEARKTFTYHMQVARVMELTLSQRFLMRKYKRLLGDSENEVDNDDDGDDDDDDGDNDDDTESDDHDDDDSDDERTESDSEEILDLNLINVDHTEYEEEDVDEGVRTPSNNEFTNEENLDEEEIMDDEEDDKVFKELYEDVNVNLEKSDAKMTDANQGGSEQHNVSQDQDLSKKKTLMVSALETEMSELKQTNQFAEVVSSIPAIVNQYLASKIKETDNVAVQLQTSSEKKPKPRIKTSSIRGQDDQDKDEDPSAGLDRGTKRRKSSKDVESSKNSRSKEKKSSSTSKEASQSQHKSLSKSFYVEEPSHTIKESGMQQDQEFVTGDNNEQPVDKEGPKRQTIYGYASNLTSSKYVYSRRRIIAVSRRTIMKKYDYDHLEEIKFRQDDQQLYTFKEGDFKRLRLQDIEDMLLLLTYCHLKAGGRSSIRCRKLPKKLNLAKPDTYRSNLRNKTAYTSHSPHGIICVDLFKRKILMRTDVLYKFSDGTLNDVRTALHDISTGIRMDYLPMRKRSNFDKKRAQIMLHYINKQLYQRRLIRNLA